MPGRGGQTGVSVHTHRAVLPGVRRIRCNGRCNALTVPIFQRTTKAPASGAPQSLQRSQGGSQSPPWTPVPGRWLRYNTPDRYGYQAHVAAWCLTPS